MKGARFLGSTAIVAFVWALPPALLLADSHLAMAPVWAAIAALFAVIAVGIWHRRKPNASVTMGVAIFVAVVAYSLTVVVFAIVAKDEWLSRVGFSAIAVLGYIWYPVLAGVGSFNVVNRLSKSHAA